MTLAQRLGYGVGDLGINLYFMSAMTYLMFFYTDVFGLSVAVAAGVMGVARTIDAVTDPLMGMIAERTRSRYGRMRPYILFGALPLGITTVLTFTTPDLSEAGKIWWAYITYIAFSIAYTVVTIPYSALTASLTDNYAERTKLSTFRMAFAFGGGYVVSVGLPFLVNLFDTPQAGYQYGMLVFSVVATLLLCLCFYSTDERIQPPPEQRLTLWASLKAVFANPPLLIVMLIFTGGMLSFTLRQSVTLYYFKYNLGREDLVPVFFAVTLPAMIATLPLVPLLTERVGKAGGVVTGALVTIVAAVGLYFTPYDQVTWVFAWSVLMAIGGTPIAVLGWAMIPDTVEYAQWRGGVRADGAIYSMASFFQKIAKTLGAAGALAVLSGVGYVANQPQTEASLDAIRWMMTAGPGVVMVGLILVCALYRLDVSTHERIVAELQQR